MQNHVVYCIFFYNFRLKRESWMYPELDDETDIISVLESCARKLGYIDKFTSDSLIDLKNLSEVLEEMGLHPSKRQVIL